jgi:hypothetical protein
MPEFMAFNK